MLEILKTPVPIWLVAPFIIGAGWCVYYLHRMWKGAHRTALLIALTAEAFGALFAIPLLPQGALLYFAAIPFIALVLLYAFFAPVLGWNPFKWPGK